MAELIAHEPHLADAGLGNNVNQLLMLLGAVGTKLAHVAQNEHLPVRSGRVQATEILQRGHHRRGISVVGIHDEAVVARVHKLRTVVRGPIVLQGVADGFALHSEVDANGHGCQQVLYVVEAHQLRLHLVPLLALARLFQLHERLAPAELEEGLVGGDDLAADAGILLLGISAVGRDPHLVGNHVHKEVVVGIKEDKAILTGTQIVVKLALGLDDAFEGTEALQVGTPHVGDDAASGLRRLDQRLDVARMAGPHLDNSYLVLGT